MKRTIVLASVLVLMASMTVLASPVRERDESNAPWGQWDSVTVTGELDIRDGYFPTLKAEGETWELMVHEVPEEIDIESGRTITVTGFEMPRHRWQTTAETRALMVETATIDGKEYILAEGPGMMMGGYGGMMGRAPQGNTRGGWGSSGGMMGSGGAGNRDSAGYGCWGTEASFDGEANQRRWR